MKRNPENYDLVILGATPEGLYAAQQALKIKGKRVALVTQGINPAFSLELTYFYAYLQQFLTQQTQLNLWQSFQPDFSGSLNHQDLMRVSQQLSGLAIQQDDRLDGLSIQGLDIIHGQGFFLPPTKTQKTVVEVENRLLRSRFYLLTVPTEPLLNWETLFRGNSYGILGSNSEALTWAYFLAKLGKSVTIITPNLNIFPQEDLEIIQLLRAYLEGLNIQFLTAVDPHHFAVKLALKSKNLSSYLNYFSPSLTITFPDLALTQKISPENSENNLGNTDNSFVNLQAEFQKKLEQFDQILDCRPLPLPTDWGLEQLKLRREKTTVWVNPTLRTSHPQIYAIGGAIAGYHSPEIAQREADLVINNTLLGRAQTMNYTNLSYSLLNYPYLGRLGLTPQQARQYYGDRVSVMTHWLQLPSTRLGDDWGSGYRCILKDHQQLVGAYYWGEETRNYSHFIQQTHLFNTAIKN